MGYLSPDHPMFNGAVPARGPGIHTDEASSALGDLRKQLEGDAWAKLATIAGADDPSATTVFANPVEDDEEETEDERIVPQAELFPVAFLTTGIWGPDPSHNLRPLEEAMGRRALPLVQENPYDPRAHLPFFERMRQLAAELDALAARVEVRYARAGAPSGGRKRPWASAIARLREAVAYVLGQEGVAAPTILGPTPLGLPKGAWRPLAAQGNKKLPFVAYSELPMATCPGAGACGVRFDYFEPVPREGRRRHVVKRKKGWCYSFKAFRYPDAFKRMFLNTLANEADREFAIIAGGGGALHPDDYAGRVQAALRGMAKPGARLWPQYIKGETLFLTRRARSPKTVARGFQGPPAPGANVFLRLFVDGDINHEDSIVAWMEAVAQMGPGSPDIGPGTGYVRCYGYTKCWQQFVNVDSYLGGRWPENYTVNLSSGSVYFSSKYDAVRTAMERLPISRGYFEAIPVRDYIPKLARQTHLMTENPAAVVPLPAAAEQPFAFDAERIRAFLRLNAVRTIDQVRALFPDVRLPLDGHGRIRPMTERQVRHVAYAYYLDRLLADPRFGAIVRRELYRDQEPASEATFLDAYEQKQRARLEQLLRGGAAEDEGFTYKALQDKALALALHETMWTYSLGGSCPLICGACSSHPTTPSLGVHRCADMTTFKGKTIHIGLH
jgi:hypothetical protein